MMKMGCGLLLDVGASVRIPVGPKSGFNLAQPTKSDKKAIEKHKNWFHIVYLPKNSIRETDLKDNIRVRPPIFPLFSTI